MVAEGPVLAADYCECELTKIAGIKHRVVEMEKNRVVKSVRESVSCVWFRAVGNE